ncbi:prephenate dehydrogenase [Halalkaliarchaeum desulfuricum]|uniref:Prephenate dehydrogenase n=2 Tax=Halalkaliarchaeum desulfuricum TaxID=2055893 RepID=A0A343TN04_9EURY|nr:prephenate dehydrogenase [Halalkaliarchaeum desulfuricum]
MGELMRLLVVGAGEMGRWVADAIAASPDAFDGDVSVTFADADREVAEDAAATRDAAVYPSDAEPGSEGPFDAVCLAVPIPAVEPAIAEWAPAADGALFDVAGTMGLPLSAMRSAAAEADGTVREYGSFHPLFAPPRTPGTVAFVPGEDGPLLSGVREAIRAGGNEVFETTAAEHDAAMETVQASAHAAILAYGLVAADADVREEFHTPVSERLEGLVETVTEGSPDVYADIQLAFDGAESVAAAASRIADARGDREAFRTLYREAGTARRRERHE